MTKFDTNPFGEDQYKIEIPNTVTGMVINNGNGVQTVDIAVSGSGNYYLDTENNGKWEVGTW